MTTIKVQDTTASLLSKLNASGFAFGDSEMPAGTTTSKPWGILYSISGGQTYGSLAGGSEMATLMYQIHYVGSTAEQCRRLQQLIHSTLDGVWRTITNCLGPAKTTVGGIVKEDERTFVCNDTLYMQVTGT